MARYDGRYNGMIRILYIGGTKPAEIYRRVVKENGGIAPCSLQTIYNVVHRFDKETQKQHTARRLSEEAEQQLRLIVEAHRRVIREMLEDEREN